MNSIPCHHDHTCWAPTTGLYGVATAMTEAVDNLPGSLYVAISSSLVLLLMALVAPEGPACCCSSALCVAYVPYVEYSAYATLAERLAIVAAADSAWPLSAAASADCRLGSGLLTGVVSFGVACCRALRLLPRTLLLPDTC